MSDFHDNIFYFYRGANLKDNQRERQLEDNTTKALINTLEHCEKSVANKFLKWLGIVSEGQSFYQLQRKSIGKARIDSKPQKLLLGITPNNKHNSLTKLAPIKDGYSRPDAWIYGKNHLVLIESKVAGSLDKDQMGRHLQTLQSDHNVRVDFKIKTWSDIHMFFTKLINTTIEKDKWLIKQFVQYLERINMSKFTGFNTEFFDYFISHDDDDVRRWVLNTMQAFAEIVQPKLYKIDTFYDEFDIGRLEYKHKYTWAGFGPKNKEYRQYAHITIAAGLEGLEILLNVELKSATDKLREKIVKSPNSFKDYLLNLNIGDETFIQIEERKQKQAMVYDYNRISRIDLYAFKNKITEIESMNYLTSLIQKIELPYFSIRTIIDRDLVCKLSQKDQGATLIENVTNICRKYNAIIKFING
ncbi:MAG: hypothetical protein HND52_07370 [Ignavibacteriae bacterium]|nr:hypothetical protein [Ignavibacteriota bacterium]NOG97764.1 hypothetical protein [Ignavibacteriota bacterium]